MSILTNSEEKSPVPPAPNRTGRGEAGVAGTSTSPNPVPVTGPPEKGCRENVTKVTSIEDMHKELASASTTATSPDTPPVPYTGVDQMSPHTTQLPLSSATKQKYQATPHLRKGALNSSTTASNVFNALSSSDEEVESLIAKVQQTKKTVHPRLLGTNGRELELAGTPGKAPPPRSK